MWDRQSDSFFYCTGSFHIWSQAWCELFKSVHQLQRRSRTSKEWDFVSLRGPFVNLGVINNIIWINLKKQHAYVPSWIWKSPSPNSLQCSVEQLTERPALTGERRTRLWEVWMRHCDVQRSGSLWLDRSQIQMDLPLLVEWFSLDPCRGQCGSVMETPQGYLEYTGSHFTNGVLLHHWSDCIQYEHIAALDLQYKDI